MSVGQKDWVPEMIGNSYVILRCLEAHPDDVLDDTIEINFIHVF